MRFLNSFKEAFLRLLIPGSVFFTIVVMGSIASLMVETYAHGEVAIEAIPYIAVPVLTVNAFSFLFKRKSSDAFFSFPIKRSTLFLSRLCAVAAWMLILYLPLFAGLLISKDATGGFLKHLYDTAHSHLLGYLVSGFYTMSVFALGTALTGRAFSAVINSGIIGFVPITIYCTVRDIIRVSLNDIIVWRSSYYNDSLQDYFRLGLWSDNMVLYLVLGALYLGLAFLAFLLRRSETAENSAPNKILRIIYGGMLGFSFALVGLRLSDSLLPIGVVMTLYGIAVLVPVLYEFISTKKLKYCLVSLGVGVLMYVLVVASCSVTDFVVRNHNIDAVGYKLISKGDGSGERTGLVYNWGNELEKSGVSYTQIMTDPFFITDKDKVELVLKRYNDNANCVPYKKENETYFSAHVVFLDKNGKRYKRIVRFNLDELNELSGAMLYEKEEFVSLTASLPAPETVKGIEVRKNTYGGYFSNSIECTDLSLYNVFYREMLSLSEKERISLTLSVDDDCPIIVKKSDDYLGRNLYVHGETEEGQKYFACYKVVPEYLPETFKRIRDLVQEDSLKKVDELLRLYSGETRMTVSLICYPDESDYQGRKNVKAEKIVMELSEPYNIEFFNDNNIKGDGEGRLPGYRKRFAGSTSLPEKFLEELKKLIKNDLTDSAEPTGVIKISRHYLQETVEAAIAIDLEYEDFMEISKMFDEVMNK